MSAKKYKTRQWSWAKYPTLVGSRSLECCRYCNWQQQGLGERVLDCRKSFSQELKTNQKRLNTSNQEFHPDSQ